VKTEAADGEAAFAPAGSTALSASRRSGDVVAE
jgi:hypothetical protein